MSPDTDEDVRAGEAALAACPFCGGKSRLYVKSNLVGWDFVTCNCGSEGPPGEGADAYRAWNTRTTPSGYIRADDVAGLAGALLAADGGNPLDGPYDEAARAAEDAMPRNLYDEEPNYHAVVAAYLRALSGGQHGDAP